MAKGRIERTVDYINRDIFEQFIRFVLRPQQTWRYHREYYAEKSKAWPAFVARDFLLKFNPVSVMLASAVYVLSRAAKAFPRVITVNLAGNYPKHVLSFCFLLPAGVLSYTLTSNIPLQGFGEAIGFASFFPSAMGLVVTASLLSFTCAVGLYAIKSYLQNKALAQTIERTPTSVFNLSKNDLDASGTLGQAQEFSAQKYLLLNAPYFSENSYNPSHKTNEESTKTERLLRHLAATRYQVKNALQTGNVKQLRAWFGGRAIHDAEAWLRDVNKPALEAVYEKLKDNYRACDTRTDASAPDEEFTTKLLPCFNNSTPVGLRSSHYCQPGDTDVTQAKLDNNVKPAFGPFTVNAR